MIFPWGLADRVFQSSCATSLMFEMDDVALLERALFNEVAADWVAEHPYGAAFKDVLETLKNNMSHGIWDRYLKDWQDYFTAALKENEFRARYEIPDLDTYLEIRRPSIGLYPYIVCMEYVLDLDLTELIPNDPDFWLVKTAAIEHGIMVNDLFSYRLEVIRGDFFNAITSLLQAHLHDLQSAVDLVAEKIRQADDAVTRLCGNLRRRYANHPYGPRIHTYTETIGAFCAGTLRWSLESSRYNGRGYGWNGRRAGAITLDSQRTTIA